MLTQVRAVARQQTGEHLVGFAIEDLSEGVHGRDRDDLVIAIEHRGEHTHGAGSGVAARDEGERVGAAHGINDVGCGPQFVKGGLDAHGVPQLSSYRARTALEWSCLRLNSEAGIHCGLGR
jgi:hypothetical protein